MRSPKLMLTSLLCVLPLLVHAQSTPPPYRVGPDLLANLPKGIEIGACSAVAIDSADNLFLFHRGQPAVLVFSPDGKLKHSWGKDAYNLAHGLRIDADGNVWTTDVNAHTVQKFTPDGKLLLTLGEKDKPGEDPSHFNKPADIAFAPNGDFFIADGYGNSRVVKFDKAGKYVTAWGKKGKADGEFDLPHAIRLDSKSNVYVADRENNRIQVFDLSGRHLRTFSELRRPGTNEQPALFSPFGLFITPDDTLFIADGRANRVLVAKTDGTLLHTFGSTGTEPGQMSLPHGIAVSPKTGVVYVTEITNKRIQQFIPAQPPRAANDAIRVACVGDSITFGSGIRNRETDSYPAQLQALLGNQFAVQNFGVSGATLLKVGDKPYWNEKAFPAAKDFNPNIVIIKLGTNDSKPQNWRHKESFAADARALIEQFQSLPAKPTVYLCLPVPAYPGNWGIDDTRIREEVIPRLKEAAQSTKTSVIDLYTALENHPEYFPDKVHPNAEGAKAMASAVHAFISVRK